MKRARSNEGIDDLTRGHAFSSFAVGTTGIALASRLNHRFRRDENAKRFQSLAAPGGSGRLVSSDLLPSLRRHILGPPADYCFGRTPLGRGVFSGARERARVGGGSGDDAVEDLETGAIVGLRGRVVNCQVLTVNVPGRGGGDRGRARRTGCWRWSAAVPEMGLDCRDAKSPGRSRAWARGRWRGGGRVEVGARLTRARRGRRRGSGWRWRPR